MIGIVTPVDMRYYLAAIPACAAAAGLGAAWAWDSGLPNPSRRRLLRLGAIVGLAATVAIGLHSWWSVL